MFLIKNSLKSHIYNHDNKTGQKGSIIANLFASKFIEFYTDFTAQI